MNPHARPPRSGNRAGLAPALPPEACAALQRRGLTPQAVERWLRRPNGDLVLCLTNGMKLVLPRQEVRE